MVDYIFFHHSGFEITSEIGLRSLRHTKKSTSRTSDVVNNEEQKTLKTTQTHIQTYAIKID